MKNPKQKNAKKNQPVLPKKTKAKNEKVRTKKGIAHK